MSVGDGARLYVAGPMTGFPGFNYPAFGLAAAQLRAFGFAVENPAELGQVDGWEWSDYLRRALTQMLMCEGVAVLRGWFGSRGARLECGVAVELGMPVRTVEDWLGGVRRSAPNVRRLRMGVR